MLQDRGIGKRNFICLKVTPKSWTYDTYLSEMKWEGFSPLDPEVEVSPLTWLIKMRRASHQAGLKRPVSCYLAGQFAKKEIKI
jgi:hypothetical protein